MLVDDYDDERTLDEEEDMEEGPDREEEIDNLAKVCWRLWYYCSHTMIDHQSAAFLLHHLYSSVPYSVSVNLI